MSHELSKAPLDPLGSRPGVVRAAAPAAGDAAASAARLRRAVDRMKASAVAPILQQVLDAARRGEWKTGSELALKALAVDESSGVAWYLLAICREKCADFVSAIQAYETAIRLLPDDREIACDLGRLALRLGMLEVAEKFFHHYLRKHPGHVEATNNLACALRDQNRYEEAVEVLRPVIYAEPETPLLWNTLGTVLSEQGQTAQSLTFFDEALRLDPDFAKARYNRGNARFACGDPQGALEDVEAALPGAQGTAEEVMMSLARATLLAACGRLGEAWDAYEARLSPHYGDNVQFLIDRPRWTPEAELAGARLLVIGEQGLGDEVLFANVLPDVLEALGPQGSLTLAVEPRLIPLFARAFPGAAVHRHRTVKINGHSVRFVPELDEAALAQADLWTPMGSLLRRFRRTVEAFPARERFLTADPARVAHWRGVLEAAGDGPKVGLLWKSLKVDGARRRYFSPFERWKAVMSVPGVRIVNLQYGDCSAELAEAKAAGFEVFDPPGIDLKEDLDEVAALTCALDLVIGPANATLNIAAACGAPVWMVATPEAWPKLGTDRFPWYPQVRVFGPKTYEDWAPALAEVAEALRTAF